MGCKKLTYQNFSFLEVIHPKKRVSAEKKRINYYPFGLKHKGYNTAKNGVHHKFEFQGQESQEELDLNWISFKWRNHDPAIGRFMNIDPLAEDYLHNSTYAFSENRVIDAVELEGMEAALLKYRTADNSSISPASSNEQYANNRKLDKRRKEFATGRPPSEQIGTAEGSKFIAEGVAIGMADVATGEVIGKLFQGAKFLKSTLSATNKVDNTVVVIGEGMGRVKDAASSLLDNGAKNVEVFTPSKSAMKEWSALTSGGEHLSDEAVMATKLYKENKVWIKNVNESGKTILDIGNDGRKNTSTFYEMEKQTVYGSQ